jgi:hypothetical protein
MTTTAGTVFALLVPRSAAETATITAGDAAPGSPASNLATVTPGALGTGWRTTTAAPDETWIAVDMPDDAAVDAVQLVGSNLTGDAQWRIRGHGAPPGGYVTAIPDAEIPTGTAWQDVDEDIDAAACLSTWIDLTPGAAVHLGLSDPGGTMATLANGQAIRVRSSAAGGGGLLEVEVYYAGSPISPDAITITAEPPVTSSPAAALADTSVTMLTFGAGALPAQTPGSLEVVVRCPAASQAAIRVYAVEATLDTDPTLYAVDSGWIAAGYPTEDRRLRGEERYRTVSHAFTAGADPVRYYAPWWRIDLRNPSAPSETAAAGGLVMGPGWSPGGVVLDFWATARSTTAVTETATSDRTVRGRVGETLKDLYVKFDVSRAELFGVVQEILYGDGRHGLPVGVILYGTGAGSWSAADISAFSGWGVNRSAAQTASMVGAWSGDHVHAELTIRETV